MFLFEEKCDAYLGGRAVCCLPATRRSAADIDLRDLPELIGSFSANNYFVGNRKPRMCLHVTPGSFFHAKVKGMGDIFFG